MRMREMEDTLKTARVLLDEITRGYKEGGAGSEAIQAIATALLADFNMAPVYHPDTHVFDIKLKAGGMPLIDQLPQFQEKKQ